MLLQEDGYFKIETLSARVSAERSSHAHFKKKYFREHSDRSLEHPNFLCEVGIAVIYWCTLERCGSTSRNTEAGLARHQHIATLLVVHLFPGVL